MPVGTIIETVFVFLILGLFVAFVGVITWAAWSSRRDFAKARKLLADMTCPNCNAPFGQDTVANAEAAWKAHVAELWRNNPGVRFRLVCLWFVTCPKCGWTGDFSPDSGNLVASKDRHNPNVAAERASS